MNQQTMDRARGVLLGGAVGDALGVPYEFATPPQAGRPARMSGGGLGPYEPGEWSDDTQMTLCIARVLATGADPRQAKTKDAIAEAFEQWRADGATDIGIQTRSVIDGAAKRTGPAASRLATEAEAVHRRSNRTAGNGALMRTSVVALAALDNRVATARAARGIAELTHADPLAGQSCVLWCEAVRVAVLEHRLDVRAGLDLLSPEQAKEWSAWIDAAEQTDAGNRLRHNGFTVTAFEAAWHAIATTPGADFAASLHAAIRIGGDTDTVGSIAGSLLGAYWGAAAIPGEWREAVHGWPGMSASDLEALACEIVDASRA